MEIKYFRLIKTIAEEGNIVNSSEKLFLTQSALSHQLIVLEERLGFKVFHRSRNKWKLTEEGQELYKLANEILLSIEKGFNSIKKIKDNSIGKIRISSECYNFYQGFGNFIQKMGILYPKINIEIVDATHQPITKILSGEIDMALVTEKPKSNLLTSIRVFEDEVLAIMHSEHRLAEKDFLEASDFEKEHLIIQTFPLETVAVYQRFLKPNNIHPIKISDFVLTEICLEMISSNMGIFCVPKWTLKQLKKSKHFVYKRLGKYGLKREHFLILRTEDRNKKYIDNFVNNFEEDFSSK